MKINDPEIERVAKKCQEIVDAWPQWKKDLFKDNTPQDPDDGYAEGTIKGSQIAGSGNKFVVRFFDRGIKNREFRQEDKAVAYAKKNTKYHPRVEHNYMEYECGVGDQSRSDSIDVGLFEHFEKEEVKKNKKRKRKIVKILAKMIDEFCDGAVILEAYVEKIEALYKE